MSGDMSNTLKRQGSDTTKACARNLIEVFDQLNEQTGMEKAPSWWSSAWGAIERKLDSQTAQMEKFFAPQSQRTSSCEQRLKTEAVQSRNAMQPMHNKVTEETMNRMKHNDMMDTMLEGIEKKPQDLQLHERRRQSEPEQTQAAIQRERWAVTIPHHLRGLAGKDAVRQDREDRQADDAPGALRYQGQVEGALRKKYAWQSALQKWMKEQWAGRKPAWCAVERRAPDGVAFRTSPPS